LQALLSRDEAQVRHGVWSDSTYLACLAHNGLACEVWVSLGPLATPPQTFSLFASHPPGLRSLLGSATPPAAGEPV